ncbi:wax ester/triacylglycerol synthase domain-containing protein [Pengzhenrongella phosphoraccumulans]|uniref:wax ester/triacylglycerol synthase domain-containing protein n=1 Tax=Pengzhenrongella phosphoraccumulans TaxID=3114394 RepID=UPI003890EB95
MSVFDLAELTADVGPNPRNVGVLLELDGPAPQVDEVRSAVAVRLGLVPRLAQSMRPVPAGAGRPVWADVAVDLDHHVRARTADPADLLTVAAAILLEPLDAARPWWTLTLVDLPAESRSALVWSSHHAMADGPSLLRAVLAIVSDGPERALAAREPVPGRAVLTREAWLARARALRGIWRLPQHLVGLRELRASSGHRVPASPLNQPVSPGYELRVVDVGLGPLRAGARTCGATVNDALLWAWGRVMHRQLAAQGLAGAPVEVSVTVTVPSAAIENRVGAVRFAVPVPGPSVARDLTALAADSRRRKRLISGSTWWLTAQGFRVIGALGLYRRFVDRQRSITTLLTNMRGPVDPLVVLGRPVTRAIPLATLVGNVAVATAALSCGGRMVVTIMCAPQTAAWADVLATDLRDGLAAVAGLVDE